MNVKACPVCGQEVLNTCYHEGDDVEAIKMPIEQAIDLTKEWVKSLKYALESYEEQLEDKLSRKELK